MKLLLLLLVIVVVSPLSIVQRGLGRERKSAVEVLDDCWANARNVRKAETAWRREWQKVGAKPDCIEAAKAFRALGCIRDGDRVGALVRALDRCELSPSEDLKEAYCAAICALAQAGAKDDAKTLLQKHRPDADLLCIAMAGDDTDLVIVNDLRKDMVTQRALIKSQRFGRLDLHGLNWPQAKLALDFVMQQTDLPPLRGLVEQHTTDLLVVTGKGIHSTTGTSTIRAHLIDFLKDNAMVYEDNERIDPGAFRVRLLSSSSKKKQ